MKSYIKEHACLRARDSTRGQEMVEVKMATEKFQLAHKELKMNFNAFKSNENERMGKIEKDITELKKDIKDLKDNIKDFKEKMEILEYDYGFVQLALRFGKKIVFKISFDLINFFSRGLERFPQARL